MIQAATGPSTGMPAASAGNNAGLSRPATGNRGVFTASSAGKVELNSGGTLRAAVLDEMAGDDADRLDAIAGRAAGLKRLLELLSFSPDLSEVAQELFRMVGREADAIYALSIQPYDEYRFAS